MRLAERLVVSLVELGLEHVRRRGLSLQKLLVVLYPALVLSLFCLFLLLFRGLRISLDLSEDGFWSVDLVGLLSESECGREARFVEF